MIQDFEMTISKDDFLRVLNKGFQELNWTGGSRFFNADDYIADIRYSRSTKRYTLICKSGRELQIEDMKNG